MPQKKELGVSGSKLERVGGELDGGDLGWSLEGVDTCAGGAGPEVDLGVAGSSTGCEEVGLPRTPCDGLEKVVR